MTIVVNILLFTAALVAMEGVALLAHKYVMHGALWCWHESHHQTRTGIFEKNDLFAVVFSIPSIVLIYVGVHIYAPLLWVGLGILAYGVVYFVFHDVIVHRRIRLRWKPKSRYMKRIIGAHWMHHSTHGKHGAVSFGFIYAPPLEKLKAARRAATPVPG